MAGTVRIIGGKWRRRRISFPSTPDLRPTPDRVRETAFNWLRAHIEGARCLDLFAGSGALGFEAASRGAAEVIMLEEHPDVARQLRQTVDKLGATEVSVFRVDAMAWLQRPSGAFDIVFVDPPFGGADLLQRACARLESGGWLNANALIYAETRHGEAAPLFPHGWLTSRSGRAGQVEYYLLERTGPPALAGT